MLNLNERLAACIKDDDGQPLVCYGCAHSAALVRYYSSLGEDEGEIVEGTDFPGKPSGERPCCFCIRNLDREKWQISNKKNFGKEIGEWYDGSPILKYPMDCYHTCDMKAQIFDWLEKERKRDKCPGETSIDDPGYWDSLKASADSFFIRNGDVLKKAAEEMKSLEDEVIESMSLKGLMKDNKATLSGMEPKQDSNVAPAPINPSTGMHEDYWILSDEERAKGFVRPIRLSYRHLTCNNITSMNQKIAETYARDPKFYGATFCCTCKKHFPVKEFVWENTNETVGS